MVWLQSHMHASAAAKHSLVKRDPEPLPGPFYDILAQHLVKLAQGGSKQILVSCHLYGRPL
jgi:hypothetical protein